MIDPEVERGETTIRIEGGAVTCRTLMKLPHDTKGAEDRAQEIMEDDAGDLGRHVVVVAQCKHQSGRGVLYHHRMTRLNLQRSQRQIPQHR